MDLYKLFRTTLVALAALGLDKPTSSLAADKPNIMIILVDDLGYGDLSCYGAKDLQSPNIDSLMADGMRFDSFYANCPVCSPTRAALLSGTYPDLVGVPLPRATRDLLKHRFQPGILLLQCLDHVMHVA